MNGEMAALHVIDGAIDIGSFITFLEKVAKYLDGRRACMLVDNLAVHHSKAVKEKALNLNIELVFNGIYSSEFNPIERLWAWSKARFTKRCSRGDV